MRKEYKSGDISYHFEEDISKDLLEVRLFNPNIFEGFDREIVIEKDGQLTELDLVNQISDMDYLEGVDINKLVNDVKKDFQDHIRLNELQSSITIEIRDFDYDISNEKSIPHTNFNIIFEDKTYNMNLPIYVGNDTSFSISKDDYEKVKADHMISNHSVFNKLYSDMEEKYGEDIARDEIQDILNCVDECVSSDTPLILKEQQEKEKKQKKDRGFGMSI